MFDENYVPSDAEIFAAIGDIADSFPPVTDEDIEAACNKIYGELDAAQALASYYMDFDPTEKNRETHCWGNTCNHRRLTTKDHKVCEECGWIICPTCGKCSPNCKH